MKSRWLLNLALGVLVAALGALAYFTPRGEDRGTFALSTLDAREVSVIRVERAGTSLAALERKGRDWQLTAPLAAPAEPFQVERLLNILSARAPQRMPAVELARFDLNAPPLKITFDTQAFHFGLVSTLTREQYVLTGGAVYVIEPRYAAAVPVDAMQLVRRRLLADGAAAVRLALPGAELTRDGENWRMQPRPATASQEQINRFAADWRLAAAARVAVAGTAPPLASVEFGLEDGTRAAFDIVQREPELVLRSRTLKLEFAFPAASAQRLLSLPGAVPLAGK